MNSDNQDPKKTIPEKKDRKLTLRQRRFLTHYLTGANLADSAKSAGLKANNVKTLSIGGRRILDSLCLTYEDLMEMAGLSDSKINTLLHEGCLASNPDGSPNWLARGKFLELVGKFSHRFIERHQIVVDQTYSIDEGEREILDHIQRELIKSLPGGEMIGYSSPSPPVSFNPDEGQPGEADSEVDEKELIEVDETEDVELSTLSSSPCRL